MPPSGCALDERAQPGRVETHHSRYDDLRRQIFAQPVFILYGVRLGEGGAVFTPPNRPVPGRLGRDPSTLRTFTAFTPASPETPQGPRSGG